MSIICLDKSGKNNISNNINSNLNNINTPYFKKYLINECTYYNLTELLLFLKTYFNIDYENFILKDEEKQEFKAKTNEFLKDFTKIYNKRQILISEQHVNHFFVIIVRFCNIDLEKVLKKFYDIFNKIEKENLPDIIEYIEPSAFVCENLIKNEESFKKKGGQYVKYKTIPKWHHYAWDMIK